MIVYGDVLRLESPAEKLARIRAFLDTAATATTWIERHQALVSALIEAGELTQSLADAGEPRSDLRPAAVAAQRRTFEIARLVEASWSGTSTLHPRAFRPGGELDGVDAGERLAVKQPEGFSFYCVYPESFGEAGRRLADLPVRMIGLRSIGTTVAAMAAAGAGAACPLTVRPIGHPYGRVLSAGDRAAVSDLVAVGRRYGIVDEGPGASGSSVAAVADALGDAGVGPDAIHLFPSHANGPGSQASEATRSFWRSARTELVTFDDLVLRSGVRRHRLECWAEDLVGEALGDLEELTGGGWRAARRIPEAEWPPVHPWQERRKFLLRSASGTWLLRFAGLGRLGETKLARALRLSQAGFVPQVAGWRHGFTVERWHDDVRPLRLEGAEREAFRRHLGRYLAWRAHAFPAASRGASLDALWDMTLANAGEAFGPAARDALERGRPSLSRLNARSYPVETDSRLHAWEWLVTQGGTFLKTDALDHHCGHDLVGPQDIAWDVAGAAVEFDLSQDEAEELRAAVQAGSRRRLDEELISCLRLCYAAFWLGSYREAEIASGDPAEAKRLHAATSRYGEAFGRVLSQM